MHASHCILDTCNAPLNCWIVCFYSAELFSTDITTQLVSNKLCSQIVFLFSDSEYSLLIPCNSSVSWHQCFSVCIVLFTAEMVYQKLKEAGFDDDNIQRKTFTVYTAAANVS